LANLLGSVVLIQFFDFTCINCLRTLPYLRAWHQRYAQHGLQILGVHTPEFSVARDLAHVKSSVGRLGITWPVIQDNEQEIWQSYANRYWPTLYFIDSNGFIRYSYQGEGGYAQIERVIQTLLITVHPDAQFPLPISHLREEDAPGAVCYPTTPEIQIDSIGNDQKPVKTPAMFEIPQKTQDGHFYLKGWWKSAQDGFSLVGNEGSILLKYHAASVQGVFAASPDPVERSLGLNKPVLLNISQDGEKLEKLRYSEDLFELNDEASLRVGEARSYTLMRNPDVQDHELLISIHGSGFTFYAFSFGSCVDPVASSKRNSQE
jgi:thiol-disulfide isomerase/thioredoxin